MNTQFLTVTLWCGRASNDLAFRSLDVPINSRSSHVFSRRLRLMCDVYMLEIKNKTDINAVSAFCPCSTRYFGICQFSLRYCGIGYPIKAPSFNNCWMMLSMMWRIMPIEKNVIHQGRGGKQRPLLVHYCATNLVPRQLFLHLPNIVSARISRRIVTNQRRRNREWLILRNTVLIFLNRKGR